MFNKVEYYDRQTTKEKELEPYKNKNKELIHLRKEVVLNAGDKKHILYDCTHAGQIKRGRFQFTGTIKNFDLIVILRKNEDITPRNLIGETNLSEGDFIDLNIDFVEGDKIKIDIDNSNTGDILSVLIELEGYFWR